MDLILTRQSVLRGESNRIRDVEEALSLHPAVRDCVVIEMPHLVRGKEPFAFVTLRAKLTGREQELRDWVRRRIAACKTLERIVVLQELPKGTTGQIDHSALKDLVRSLETGIDIVG